MAATKARCSTVVGMGFLRVSLAAVRFDMLKESQENE